MLFPRFTAFRPLFTTFSASYELVKVVKSGQVAVNIRFQPKYIA